MGWNMVRFRCAHQEYEMRASVSVDELDDALLAALDHDELARPQEVARAPVSGSAQVNKG